MRDRPWYISLLCILMIAGYSYWAVRCFQTLESKKMVEKMASIHLTFQQQKIQYFISVAVPLFSAFFIWEGKNWARVLYILWGIANYLLEAVVVPRTTYLFPGVTFWAFACILLLLPRARGYFLLPDFFT